MIGFLSIKVLNPCIVIDKINRTVKTNRREILAHLCKIIVLRKCLLCAGRAHLLQVIPDILNTSVSDNQVRRRLLSD